MDTLASIPQTIGQYDIVSIDNEVVVDNIYSLDLCVKSAWTSVSQTINLI